MNSGAERPQLATRELEAAGAEGPLAERSLRWIRP
jgi:hypothetical protein